MTEAFILQLMSDALWTMLMISAPALIGGFVVGIIISVFQSVTQIQETTLTFIPKIVTIFLMLLLFGGSLLNQMMDYTIKMLSSFPGYIQ